MLPAISLGFCRVQNLLGHLDPLEETRSLLDNFRANLLAKDSLLAALTVASMDLPVPIELSDARWQRRNKRWCTT